MRIGIISNGTEAGSFPVNLDTGEPIADVTAFTYRRFLVDGYPVTTLQLAVNVIDPPPAAIAPGTPEGPDDDDGRRRRRPLS